MLKVFKLKPSSFKPQPLRSPTSSSKPRGASQQDRGKQGKKPAVKTLQVNTMQAGRNPLPHSLLASSRPRVSLFAVMLASGWCISFDVVPRSAMVRLTCSLSIISSYRLKADPLLPLTPSHTANAAPPLTRSPSPSTHTAARARASHPRRTSPRHFCPYLAPSPSHSTITAIRAAPHVVQRHLRVCAPS
ncbi:hypothetical protein C8R46DRAFT_1117393, partial [Mycena filopes]